MPDPAALPGTAPEAVPAPAAGSPAPAATAGRDAEARPLGVEFTPTGDPAVDAALGRLEALDGVPTEGHLPVYEDVHQRLGETLAALDRS
ncbi:hypothetical protein GCM10010495_63320 [Kitasatospora herbaricolor]|uniref:hypothetical protein n=1 Tax=Kitasatospora herbaricolor TaxID=68217 RepID=UPI001749B3E9|nr:hypothetical protein [Kitasatospora herbaricolor]MDQ0311278.1 hypothetical protein [Kitasatospora herbaricolor]GGV37405.1 hypothetical protein GCM10010495_63320 [Kitasatospora herbaricolor]